MKERKCLGLREESDRTPVQKTAATVESVALTHFVVQGVLAAGARNTFAALKSARNYVNGGQQKHGESENV